MVGAFTTQDDIIASPASVGSTLEDAASGDASIGERDAIKFAFISDGTVVDGTNTSGDDGPYTVPAGRRSAGSHYARSVLVPGRHA